jgi:hypothetical protein
MSTPLPTLYTLADLEEHYGWSTADGLAEFIARRAVVPAQDD